MSSLQERLAAVTDMQFVAIAAAANLKSQLSDLEGLRERVRKAMEIAAPETMERYGATHVPNWRSTMNLPSANIEGVNTGHAWQSET
jgi:hypothetical protein